MIAEGLSRLCLELSEVALAAAPGGPSLEWLAERLHAHTGAAVAVWMVTLVGGEMQPSGEHTVGRASCPVPRPEGTLLLRDLVIDGCPADPAGRAAWGLTATDSDGERALVFRCRLEFAVLWLRVAGPASLVGESATWEAKLPPLLHDFVRLSNFAQRADFRHRQDEFFNTLLDTKPRDPRSVFGDLCSAWHRFSGALWAWMWLYNPLSEAFELIASASANGANHPGDQLPPGFRPSNSSAAAYATHTDQVVAVDDPQAWRAAFGGHEYRAVNPDLMESRGGKSFVCVPVVASGLAQNAALVTTPIRGAVCLHYRDLADMPPMAFPGLRRMGQATAQAVVNSFTSLHHEILIDLNGMAGRYLTGIDRKPEADRQAYLQELIEVIQRRMNFRMVSVFWKVPFKDEVACLATTGLRRGADGTPVPPDRLEDVRYAARQGRTGECFATSLPRVFAWKAPDPDAVGPYYEVDPDTGVSGEPFALQPIPEDAAGARRAAGVIRCVGRPHTGNSFLQLELEPLTFIAGQVRVVLRALEGRIQREKTISIVKHDLQAPLAMIRNTVDRMRLDSEEGLPLREYALADLDAASFMEANLVSQLETNPDDVGRLSPEPTLLEGDILARVVGMLRPFARGHRRMSIEFDNIRVIPKLMLDRILIERIVHNLLVNAIKYGTPHSTIRIEGRRSRSGYLLDVSNEGIGIEEDEAPLIGKLHYRSPRAKAQAMGLGLGLYIATKAMEKHGGKLITSRLKNPTTFTLYFPVQLDRIP